jgi:MFS family permease
LSRCITSEYNPILKASFHWPASIHRIPALSLAATQAATVAVTDAMFTFPLSCAFVIVIYGFFSDKLGRKIASTSLLAISLISLALLVVGANAGWNPYVIGIFIGLFLGADWNNSDTLILMCGESAPTNLRASVLSVQTLFYGAGMVISQGLAGFVLDKLPSTQWIGYFALDCGRSVFRPFERLPLAQSQRDQRCKPRWIAPAEKA